MVNVKRCWHWFSRRETFFLQLIIIGIIVCILFVSIQVSLIVVELGPYNSLNKLNLFVYLLLYWDSIVEIFISFWIGITFILVGLVVL